MKITGRNTAFTYAGADSKFGIACESATPSDAKQTTPSATNTTSATQSCGQSMPKNSCPATMMSATWSAVFVTALPAMPGQVGRRSAAACRACA